MIMDPLVSSCSCFSGPQVPLLSLSQHPHLPIHSQTNSVWMPFPTIPPKLIWQKSLLTSSLVNPMEFFCCFDTPWYVKWLNFLKFGFTLLFWFSSFFSPGNFFTVYILLPLPSTTPWVVTVFHSQPTFGIW